MAGLVSAVPQLVWLSEHKLIVFTLAGALLVAACLLQWRARSLPCPADPALARACNRYRIISLWVTGFAILIYLVGFFFAFLAADLLL